MDGGSHDRRAPSDIPIVRAAAANVAAWHDASISALGFASHTGRWWWCAPTPAPWIYFTAVALDEPTSPAARQAAAAELSAHLEDPDGSFEAVCESFATTDLRGAGLTLRSTGVWFARPAGPPPEPTPAPGVEVVEVAGADDLATYELVATTAFGAPAPITPFEIHAPGILDDPAMHVLLARVDGDVVGGGMAYVTDDALGIYGVATLAGHRGRGSASALTTAALAVAIDRPAVLQPSAEAASLYRRLGFAQVGRFTHWG